MSKKHDLPAMPFYVGDWLKCPEVRALPLDYRALWFDMICFMWESKERGVMVKSNGVPYTKEEIIRMVGLDNQGLTLWLTYLIDNQVCSVREDGAIYSKRMVRNEEIRLLRSKGGKRGGNPNLKVNYKVKQMVKQNTETEYEYENEVKDVVNTTILNTAKKLKIPTLEQVKNYCMETNSSVDPETFFTHYASQGWIKANGQPIINWKLTIKTWERKDKKESNKEVERWNKL